jgi:hypothetical protein
MPMKLNVGVSRKIGLPDYGSVGASCNLELELDAGLLERDLEGFHSQIRTAYVAAHQAVHDELARLHATNGASRQKSPNGSAANGPGSRNGHERSNGNFAPARRGQSEQARSPKPATPNQVKAIHAIARKQDFDLMTILRQDFEVDRAEELTLRQASSLIDQLKSRDER